MTQLQNERHSTRLPVSPEDIPIPLIKACKGERDGIYLQGKLSPKEKDIDHLQGRTVDNDHVLSKTLSTTEWHYQPTELENTDFVWVIKKIRHLANSSRYPTVIEIDCSAMLNKTKQTS